MQQPRPLLKRLRLERRNRKASDGAGNFLTAWEMVCDVRADVDAINGGEVTLADKVRGLVSWRIVCRSSQDTRSATSDDRFTDLSTGAVYEIRSAYPLPADPARYLEIIAQSGIAAPVAGA